MSQQVKSAFTAKQVNRRQFLATTAKAGCVMGLVGLGLTATAKSQGQLALKLAGRQVPLKKAIFSRPVCAAVYVLRLAPTTHYRWHAGSMAQPLARHSLPHGAFPARCVRIFPA